MKYKATLERKIITYSELWDTSYSFLICGQKTEKRSYHQFLGSIVFSAFALEAFLNHIGDSLYSSWSEMEKKLDPKSKIAIICEKLEIKPDYGTMPWQIIPEIIGFRNKIAHGKSEFRRVETITECHDEYSMAMYQLIESSWGEFVTESNAIRIHKEMEVLFEIIHQKAKIPRDVLFSCGVQAGAGEVLE